MTIESLEAEVMRLRQELAEPHAVIVELQVELAGEAARLSTHPFIECFSSYLNPLHPESEHLR